MLDLDARREERFGTSQQFKVLGNVFTVKRGVKPEVMLEWEDMTPGGIKAAQALEELDTMVKRLLVNADVERWDAMRAIDGDENVDMTDLQELIPELIAMATGRPFGKSASSGPASEKPTIGTPSTGISATTPERALATPISEAR